ncbi:MAG: hypothetical protein HY074_03640 [Deltaproteobacteria bacterium]|nr:hypothetical protein [Deltaproteobacteria bacterium]
MSHLDQPERTTVWRATVLKKCSTFAFTSAFLFLCASTHAAEEADPFADVEEKPTEQAQKPQSWTEKLFSENFALRKELMSEFGTTGKSHSASRQSAGFEIQKKFSTETKTILGLDFQGRLVRRDGFVGSMNDLEGRNRPRWFFEYHNAYADLYDLAGSVGSVNARIGRFYVPFGLNLATDTHGTILQLSNERNFGFERDWYTGFWGILSDDLRYDVYYLAGSGYAAKFKGQSGLGAARVSLANKYQSEDGLEAGLAVIGGQRIDPEATMRSPAVMADAGMNNIVNTLRAGVDGRYRIAASSGTFTWTSEVGGGRDKPDAVVTQLHQLDYLRASRRWGLSAQYRWFWQDMRRDQRLVGQNAPSSTDSSFFGEATWYFSNDVSASNLHWIKLNCEYQLARQTGDKNVIWTLQYYRYW